MTADGWEAAAWFWHGEGACQVSENGVKSAWTASPKSINMIEGRQSLASWHGTIGMHHSRRLIAFTAALFCIAFGSQCALAQEAVPSVVVDRRAEMLADFEAFLDILRTDYAGFETKTAGDRGNEFEKLAAEARSAIADSPSLIDAKIDALVAWFEDQHLSVKRVSGTPAPQTSPTNGSSDFDALREQGRMIAPERVAEGLADGQELAGEWMTVDGVYTLALIGDPQEDGQQIAVVRKTTSPAWAPGQVKFTLSQRVGDAWDVAYRMGDHSERAMRLAKIGDGTMLKLYDEDVVVYLQRSGANIEELKSRLFNPQEFSLTRLSDETLLIRLPNFFAENRPVIEAMLAEHHEALTSTENLVIDVRYNNGGSEGSYSELMRYLYTRPIYAIGIEFLGSQRNIAGLEALLAKYRDSLDSDTVDYVEGMLAKARSDPGEWVVPLDRGFTIDTRDEVLPSPKRIGILTEGAGSSGDQFVIDARFSSKVTTFGRPTAGVIDYSNVIETPLPSGDFVARWPTTRSLRLPEEPYDNIGVPPDIPFGHEVVDPIGYVQAWLERQTD